MSGVYIPGSCVHGHSHAHSNSLMQHACVAQAAIQDRMHQLPEAFNFTLSNQAILEFDQAHPPTDCEGIPVAIQWGYDILLFFVDRLYEGRAIERFWFLETVRYLPLHV